MISSPPISTDGFGPWIFLNQTPYQYGQPLIKSMKPRLLTLDLGWWDVKYMLIMWPYPMVSTVGKWDATEKVVAMGIPHHTP